jgi:hypothetical protein
MAQVGLELVILLPLSVKITSLDQHAQLVYDYFKIQGM